MEIVIVQCGHGLLIPAAGKSVVFDHWKSVAGESSSQPGTSNFG